MYIPANLRDNTSKNQKIISIIKKIKTACRIDNRVFPNDLHKYTYNELYTLWLKIKPKGKKNRQTYALDSELKFRK